MATGGDDAALLEKFSAWCVVQGIDLSGCRLERTPDRGLSVIATRAIHDGHAALAVPLAATLTVAAVARSAVGRATLGSSALGGERVSAQALMYIVMIDGRARPESLWHPWLALLPCAYSDPLWWTAEERRRLLEGTQLAHDAARHEAQLRDVYDGLFPALSRELPEVFPAERFTFEAFRWARSALASRSFSPAALGEPPPACARLSEQESSRLRNDCPAFQCPLLDFTNHDPGTVVSVGLKPLPAGTDGASERHLMLSVKGGVSAGSEILNNYGDCRSNFQLLLGYGFCVPGNAADAVPVRLGAPPNLPALRRGALRRAGLALDEGHALTRAEPLPPRMLAVLRVLLMTERSLIRVAKSSGVGPLKKAAAAAGSPEEGESADAAELQRRAAFLASLSEPLEPSAAPACEGELAVLGALRQQLLHKLEAVAAVKLNANGGVNERNAAHYRQGQEGVLTAALTAAKNAEKDWCRRHGISSREEEEQEGEEGGEEEEPEVDEEVEPEPVEEEEGERPRRKRPRSKAG
mmetsp:Transcript_79225/g.222269  ORF Transcript_79225/g.222269 Transcript_79225/m.222269 type:complete len:525 (-) Transcript_79225:114-1688(-)